MALVTTSSGAQRHPQRLCFVVMASVLALTACAGTKEEAAALLPPAVVAEGKLQAQADLAACRKANGSSGEPVRVSGSAVAGTTQADCTPRTPASNALETGAIPAREPTALPAAITSNSDGTKPTTDELYIDFIPGSFTLSDREKVGIREAVAARLLSGPVRLRVAAARGGSGNLFDQATAGEKRARFVKDILPPRLVDSAEFDPSLPEDTVRIEFYRPVKSNG